MADPLRAPAPLPLRWAASLCAALALTWALAGAALADPRLALVVGNSNYQAVVPLDNAEPDARLIAETLTEKGFDVTLLIDADQNTLNQAIAQFGRALRDAGTDAVGLFYYAGHGVQSFGTNYLVPVDAVLTDAADLSLVAVQADAVLRQMASARNRTNIVILDACRDNPFVSIPDMNDNGLAEMNAPTGTFLAYSTAPGAVALDGLDGNSPFTRSLAQQIRTPGEPIEQVFKATRVDVIEATRGLQTPWDTSSLTRDFYFTPAVQRTAEEIAEQQLWESVRQTSDPLQLMLFLRGYPDSTYAPEARQLLSAALNAELAAQTAAAAPPAAPSAPQAPAAGEDEMIAAAQASGEAADYQAYLDAHPNGVYAELARIELAAIAERLAVAAPPAAPAQPEAAAPSAEAAAVEAALPAPLTYTTPLGVGGPGIAEFSIEQLARAQPLYPPIEGIPDELWKGENCTACHTWTREALCTQGETYVGVSMERALVKQHPLGGVFKQGLRRWAEGGCQ